MSARVSPLLLEPAYRRVATEIATRILDRRLAEGEALPTETALAAQLGVNRSTLREALRELESDGLVGRRRGTKRLVVTRPQTTAVTERISRDLALNEVTVLELWETLTMLAPPAAETAARRRSAGDIAAMSAANQTLVQTRGRGAADVQAVSEFFRAIVAATGNRSLSLAFSPTLRLLEQSLKMMIDRVPQARTRIITAQRELLAAVEARDAVRAAEWMRKHIRDFRRGFELAGIELERRVTWRRRTPPRAAVK